MLMVFNPFLSTSSGNEHVLSTCSPLRGVAAPALGSRAAHTFCPCLHPYSSADSHLLTQYDHALHLYPLPNSVVVADTSPQAQHNHQGCSVFNPVSIKQEKTLRRQ
jgi:hypothetical protein